MVAYLLLLFYSLSYLRVVAFSMCSVVIEVGSAFSESLVTFIYGNVAHFNLRVVFIFNLFAARLNNGNQYSRNSMHISFYHKIHF